MHIVAHFKSRYPTLAARHRVEISSLGNALTLGSDGFRCSQGPLLPDGTADPADELLEREELLRYLSSTRTKAGDTELVSTLKPAITQHQCQPEPQQPVSGIPRTGRDADLVGLSVSGLDSVPLTVSVTHLAWMGVSDAICRCSNR